MSTVAGQDGADLRLELPVPAAARLFGVPFLLVGGYLGYHLGAGILDLLTGRAALSEMLVGTLLLVVLAAAFLIPGWLLVFARARVEIDRAARTVTYVRDFGLYRRAEVRPLSEFSAIEVDVLTVSSSRRSGAPDAFQVELAGSNRRNVVIGLLDDGEEAVAFGHRMGVTLGLPVSDLRHIDRPGDE
jgi:hypothetical protein